MDHPLLKSENSELRKRVIDLVKRSLEGPRDSNIVFVCGGNKTTDMRPKFEEFFREELKEFVYFQPEFAMENYFSDVGSVPFDIADFEEIVGELSCAIVLFPEAPGSYAEAGYFSAIDNLASKTLIVLDIDHQSNDSFISMGPAKRFSERSTYRPEIQLNYSEPNFQPIAERIRRYSVRRKKKHFSPTKFSNLRKFDGLGLILKIVDLLSIATIEDIKFILRGLFDGHISEIDVRNLTSILVGGRYISEIGNYGHYCKNSSINPILSIRTGFKEHQSAILLSLGALYVDADEDFTAILEEFHNAC